jgi:putative flippase GtrA
MPVRANRHVSQLAKTFAVDARLTLARYVLAGVGVSFGYTVTVIALMEVFGWRSPAMANVVSFLLWTLPSYFVHRDFTFRFDGEHRGPAAKYALTFCARLLTSVVVVSAATNYFHLHYIVGVLTNWIALPLVAYSIMKVWIFRETP